MTRYWISWNEYSEDYRPITSPPTGPVLGWWCSGHGEDHVTLCAVVRATSALAAKEEVLKNWPSGARLPEWRFCEQKDADFTPGDRFPVRPESWSAERFGMT